MNNNDGSNNILSPMIGNPLNPTIFTDLQKALLDSLHASTQEDVNRAYNIIAQHQSHQGYMIQLVQIINNNLPKVHNQLHESLISGTLTQLKVFIRSYWRKMSDSKNNDCQYLVKSLVGTSFNLSRVDNARIQVKYMKLLKDVVEMTSQQTIVVYPDVIALIKANHCTPQSMTLLPACLNIVLGVINNISLLARIQYSEKSIDMVEKLHPLLYEFTLWGEREVHALYEQLMVQSNCQNPSYLQQYLQFKRKYEEILYLNIKFFYKALFIRDLDRIRPIILTWIPLAISRVDHIDPAFTSPDQQDLVTGLRGTDEFNYFHGKKWALKMVRRAMDRVLVYSNRNQPERIPILKFYQLHLHELTQIFKTAWQHQWPQRIKFELLRTLERLIQRQPFRLVKQYEEDLKYYQETLLPPMIDLSNEKDILEESPTQFLYRQETFNQNSASEFQSCRLAAARVWLNIARIDFLYDKSCQNSKMLMDSLLQLNRYLETVSQQTLQLRDIACFLLIKLHKKINKMDELKEGMKLLVNRTIRENLEICDNSYFMVLVRALELAKAYQELLQEEVIAMVRERILTIFRQVDLSKAIRYDTMILLQRGSEVLCQMVSIQTRMGIKLSSDDAKLVVVRLFDLVRLTSTEEFIVAVNEFLRICMECLSDCYKEIALFLQGWFVRYMELDVECYKTAVAMEYKRDYMEIARGTISIYETILIYMNQDDHEIVSVLDSEVFKIVAYIFTSRHACEDSFLENGVNLLSVYLTFRNRNKRISSKIMTLCRLMLLQLAGLTAHTLKEVRQKKIQDKQQQWTKILLTFVEQMSEGLNTYVPIARLFVKHTPYGEAVRSYPEISRTILRKQTSNTQYIIYLVNRFFASSNPSKYSLMCNGKCFSLLTMIHYYEHHQRGDCTSRVHSSFNQFAFNLILQVHREYPIKKIFAKYNSQLFCLWIHEVQENFVQYTGTLTLPQLSNFLSSVLIFERHFGLRQMVQYEQCIRCTFGLSTLIRLGIKFQDVWRLLQVELWIQLVSFAIRFGYNSTDNFADNQDELLTVCEDATKQHSHASKSINYNTQTETRQTSQEMDIVNGPNNISAYGSEEEWEDEEGSSVGSDEEVYSLDSADEDDEECWAYEQSEQRSDPSPLESQDDGKYLLDTLYGLLQTNQRLYRSIIGIKGLADQVTAILHSLGCYNNPQLSHLCQLTPDNW